MDRRLVLVAGSSRSGTSLFTGMLRALGAHVPQPEVEPDDSNPRGFSEPRWVVEFHSRMLRAVGVQTGDARPSAWAKTAEVGRDHRLQRELDRWVRKELRHGRHVVVKDPRLVWFVPMWTRAAAPAGGPRFVTVLRHPIEVVQSQQTYYVPWHPNSRVGGWLNTMLFGERATRGQQRSFVAYDDLLGDWMPALAAVCRDLDLALVDAAGAAQMRAVNQLVDPSLRRSRGSWESLGVDARLAGMADEVWLLLDRLRRATGEEVAPVLSDLDAARREYVALYDLAETLTQSTLFAAEQASRGLLALVPRWSPSQPPLTVRTAAAKAIGRVRRGTARRLHRLRTPSA